MVAWGMRLLLPGSTIIMTPVALRWFETAQSVFGNAVRLLVTRPCNTSAGKGLLEGAEPEAQ